MKRDQAIKLIRAEKETIRRQYLVKSFLIFGSVARDQAMPGSDIDP